MAEITYAFGGLEKLPPNMTTSYAPIITRTVISFVTAPVVPTITPTITAIITTTIVKNCSDVSVSCERDSTPQTTESSRAFFAQPLDGFAIPVIFLLVGIGGVVLVWMFASIINGCRRYLESKRSKRRNRESI
ncbi:hypothetical protein BPOR_0071g00030 [Botrytis porri]|uniref:Uncharacterized protein n=1 Tax=Botrytis porri TaxID=87229 RepID=A0A4Z1L0M9_9HELO|nr:hypothetical protein BPOR_0071g00030 [Botrytis porri]